MPDLTQEQIDEGLAIIERERARAARQSALDEQNAAQFNHERALRFDIDPAIIDKLTSGGSLTEDEGRAYLKAQKKAFKGIVPIRHFFRLAGNAAARDARKAAGR